MTVGVSLLLLVLAVVLLVLDALAVAPLQSWGMAAFAAAFLSVFLRSGGRWP